MIALDHVRDRFCYFKGMHRVAQSEIDNPNDHGWRASDVAVAHGAFVSYIVSPTGRCNGRCRYCFADHYENGEFPLNANEIGHLARQARIRGFLRCDLSGGEPLLREDIVDLVEAMVHHVGVMLTTSARNIPTTRLTKLARLLPVIQVSLDGHTDSMNAARGDSAANVIRNIRRLIDFGTRVRVLTVAHRLNAHLMPEFAKALGDWGVWEWKILRVIPSGRALGWDGVLTDQEATALVCAVQGMELPTQFVGFGKDPQRVCVVIEDNLHLMLDRDGIQQDLGHVVIDNPFAGLSRFSRESKIHLDYYLDVHSSGGRFARADEGT